MKNRSLLSLCASMLIFGTIGVFRNAISLPSGLLAMSRGLIGAAFLLLAAAILLTGFGVFDSIAKVAGAGTLVPVTGFANSVVSPAIDTKAEGLILGVGAKIFTVAGPVILYGILSGALYGVVLLVMNALE